ncbi:MAG: hypothetical protein PUH96_08415 [Coriobacteriaceae bacterium]|nr:hypothetical protein [Coriobacteriaceae bacterium]
MDESSVRVERDFHNLTVNPRRMHLLDEPHGYVSALAKKNLAHQMRFSVKTLEDELLAVGTPHVLQIELRGDDLREPAAWTLFADGEDVASGTGVFARECFYEGAGVFLDVCRDAVHEANLPEWSEREYRLLSAARKITAV